MNSNGMPITPFLGYARNFLGSGYNCPALKLFGYRTERQLNNAIKGEVLRHNEMRGALLPTPPPSTPIPLSDFLAQ